MQKKSLALLPFVLVANAVFAAQTTAPSLAPASVFTEKVKRVELFSVLSFPARVESKVNAMIRAESEGVISRIDRPLGSSVRRGETIAIVKHTDPVYEYAPLTIRAPLSGIINEVKVTPGSLVNKGDEIVSITDPAQTRIVIEVAALDVRSIQRGAKGNLEVAGLVQPLIVTVEGISPSIDPMLGTATCELALSNADRKIVMPGMVGKVKFKLNQHQGILLADSSIFYRGDKTFVRVVENGHTKRMPVTIGERRQGAVEILNGLNDGEEVINRTSRYIGDGETVKVETTHD